MSLLTRLIFFTILIFLAVGQELSDVTVPYTDAGITYSGTWFFRSGRTCTMKATAMAGASATLRFRGVAIKIHGNYELSGIPVVLLDGVQYAIIPGRNVVGCQELIFDKTGLDDKDHTVEMRWTTRYQGELMGLFSFTYTEVKASTSPQVDVATSAPSSSGDASTSSAADTASTEVPATSTEASVSSTSMPISSTGTEASTGLPDAASTSLGVSSTGVSGPTTEVALSTGNRSAGTIAGASVGILGAIVLSALLFLGFEHILYHLTHWLFGWSAWKGRWLIFRAPAHLSPTQISLFLTNDDSPIDPEKDSQAEHPESRQPQPDKPIVWKVFDIGGAQREFIVEIPCLPVTGNVKLGFATIEEPDPNFVRCQAVEKAPARLDGNAWEHEGDTDSEKPAKPAKNREAQPKQTAKNMNDFGVRIALGTYHEDTSTVQPSLLVEQVPGDGGSYEAKEDFYIHAFRTNGYSAGQYGPTIFKDADGDQLTPENGIKISELAPLTCWYIESDSQGRLTVRIGRNTRKDVKEYRHKCKIEKDAIRNKSEERMPLIRRS